jgi:hypothetical protein
MKKIKLEKKIYWEKTERRQGLSGVNFLGRAYNLGGITPAPPKFCLWIAFFREGLVGAQGSLGRASHSRLELRMSQGKGIGGSI